MRIFKTRWFHRWAKDRKLSDTVLIVATREISRGLFDANLGGCVLKKRISLDRRGKRGGLRTIVAFNFRDRIIFMYGFAKNDRADIKVDELKALKSYAHEMLRLSEAEFNRAIISGIITEVTDNGQEI